MSTTDNKNKFEFENVLNEFVNDIQKHYQALAKANDLESIISNLDKTSKDIFLLLKNDPESPLLKDLCYDVCYLIACLKDAIRKDGSK